MKWTNLRLNKCPKCDKKFDYNSFSEKGFVVCASVICRFRISEKRYSEIVNSQVTASLEKQWDEEENEE